MYEFARYANSYVVFDVQVFDILKVNKKFESPFKGGKLVSKNG